MMMLMMIFIHHHDEDDDVDDLYGEFDTHNIGQADRPWGFSR